MVNPVVYAATPSPGHARVVMMMVPVETVRIHINCMLASARDEVKPVFAVWLVKTPSRRSGHIDMKVGIRPATEAPGTDSWAIAGRTTNPTSGGVESRRSPTMDSLMPLTDARAAWRVETPLPAGAGLLASAPPPPVVAWRQACLNAKHVAEPVRVGVAGFMRDTFDLPIRGKE